LNQIVVYIKKKSVKIAFIVFSKQRSCNAGEIITSTRGHFIMLSTQKYTTKGFLFALAVITLLLPMQNASALEYSNPKIRFDAQGNGVAVWQVFDDYINSIQMSTKIDGDPWTTLVTISDPTIDSQFPLLRLNQSGDGIIAWLITDPLFGNLAIAATVKSYDSNDWSPITILSTPYEVTSTDIAIGIDESGNIGVSWKSYNLVTMENTIYTKMYSPSSGWDPNVQISE
jgi:hypothetical protein